MAVHPGSQWIDRNWNELRDYNNRWIAATNEGVLESDQSFDRLVERIQASELMLADITFAFVCFDIIQ